MHGISKWTSRVRLVGRASHQLAASRSHHHLLILFVTSSKRECYARSTLLQRVSVMLPRHVLTTLLFSLLNVICWKLHGSHQLTKKNFFFSLSLSLSLLYKMAWFRNVESNKDSCSTACSTRCVWQDAFNIGAARHHRFHNVQQEKRVIYMVGSVSAVFIIHACLICICINTKKKIGEMLDVAHHYASVLHVSLSTTAPPKRKKKCWATRI